MASIHAGDAPQVPPTRQSDTVDTYFEVEVADPYRWLEDDHADETKAWVVAQNEVTHGYLVGLPEREVIHQELTDLWNYERFSTPYQEGGRYFWRKNDGLQNQSVLYTAKDLDGEAKTLLDPNLLSDDGTVAMSGSAVSRDGRLLAYGLSEAGSDWKKWKVRDIETGKDLPDEIKWVKFSGASWLPDGSGFYYSRYDEPEEGDELTGQNYFQKLFLHRLGEPQSEDVLIYERTDEKEWGFDGGVTDDGGFLLIHVWEGTSPKNALFYQRRDEAGEPIGEIVEFLREFDASYSFIDNVGDIFFLQSDRDAPRGKVIAIDVENPNPKSWTEIVPESDETLEWVSHIGDLLYCGYLRDAVSVVRVYDRKGTHVRDLELPGLGSVHGFHGRREDTETFFHFTSFTEAGSIYRHDVATGKSELYRQSQIDFDSSGYETSQVFVSSKDGTRVPLFLVHKTGIELDGTHPTLLYGYGGFNVSLGPSFSISRTAWLERGGVYALAILRGGGEYGEDWHEAGTKMNKQNVFDDFMACAEWLVETKYTAAEHLGIEGGSNGGLLVGACMTQHPERFGAAVPAVGVMDMLRYHKFTIGWAWADDYGTSEDSEEMFRYLLGYSPLHNLRKGVAYPATLVTTADHDDRVVPAHSFKFTARLQECHAGDNPVLIRIETSAGHGAGTPTTKAIDEAADKWAFLLDALTNE